MNLQKHIEQKAEEYCYPNWQEEVSYKAGFQAALDLELPIKFAEWMQIHTALSSKKKSEHMFNYNSIHYNHVKAYSIEQLYSRFLETLELI